jgi:hypothetical protein
MAEAVALAVKLAATSLNKGSQVDAMKLDVSLETPRAVHSTNGSTPSEHSEVGLEKPVAAQFIGEAPDKELGPRLNAAMATLLEAMDYAHDLNVSIWDFAIEISSLRSLNLTNNDLRWLIGRGFVDHSIEVTPSGDAQRSFRQCARPLFRKNTCFVITAAGEIQAKKHCQSRSLETRTNGRRVVRTSVATIAPAPKPLVPKWDRDRQELRLGSIVVKRFKVPAANQETILAVFEEESWPTRIDDPLSSHPEQSPKRRLQETIKSLNRNQKRPLIRFVGDGSGEGVRWEFGEQNATEETVDALQPPHISFVGRNGDGPGRLELA